MANVIRALNVYGPLLVSILLIFFAAFDIMHDISMGDGVQHILAETIVFFLGFVLNLFFVHRITRHWTALENTNRAISINLETSARENVQLKLEQQKIREGLHLAIEAQMKQWHLSPSEIDIAFLVLKGLSNKEIAEVRKTSESTVRLQCSAIYKKSQLGSRSELAAYFLEDIL